MLPDTYNRVSRHTADAINQQIADQMDDSIEYHARHPEMIDDRLRELDREWDIERTLEANAATLALSGVLLGAFIDRRFLVLPAVVTGFLLQHAVQGWCPPLPVFRRLGVRTAFEIEQERYALKALRGDFGDRATDGTASARKRARRALDAVRA